MLCHTIFSGGEAPETEGFDMPYTILELGRGRKTYDDEPCELGPVFASADVALAKAREYAADDLKDGRYATAKSGCWLETAGVVFFEGAIAVPDYEVWENYGDEDGRLVGAVSARDLDETLDALCREVESNCDGYVLSSVCSAATVLDENDNGNRLVTWDGFFGERQAVLPGSYFRDGAELLPRDDSARTRYETVDEALASGAFSPARESEFWGLFAEVVEVAITAAL